MARHKRRHKKFENEKRDRKTGPGREHKPRPAQAGIQMFSSAHTKLKSFLSRWGSGFRCGARELKR